MMLKKILSTTLLGFVSVGPAWANQSTGEKIEDASRDAKRSVKKGVHKVKDETCEMVNGKMECLAKHAKNKVHEGADATKDKAKEIKDKVD